ncbi:MAG: ribonuclease E/G [Lachnospiraceae bacterium]|nr:ribonuclease E/G [Lachnospiraceae bacterium]
MSRSVLQSTDKGTARDLEMLRTSESGKLIITSLDKNIIGFLTISGKIKCITVLGKVSSENSEPELTSDDIVIAYVKDVKSDLGACFIEYAQGFDGYLPVNKLPKGMNVKQGDLIPVRLTSQAQKGKRASFTAKIDYSKYENSDELKNKASHLSKYSYLYKSENSYTDRINKVFRQNEYQEIVTDRKDIFDVLLKNFSNVRFYEDPFGLDKLYSLRTALDEALDRNVWLKCGGFLIFDKTEAMTVIDVNSGKYTPAKGTDKESAYMSVNREAAEEICRQLRLRNISGIVIIDFINLSTESDREELLEILRTGFESDTVTVMVIDITQLGLVEITRKKEFPPLYEQLK